MENSAYEKLKFAVVNGYFDLGSRLKPEELKVTYNSSSSTLREAMFRLSTEGLVDFQERRGFRLPPASREICHDLTQFRIILEREGAVLSVRNGGVAWEAQLMAAHHKLSHIEKLVHSGNDNESVLELWVKAEQEFHQTLISACDSDVIKKTHALVYQQFRQQLMSLDKTFVHVPENIGQHADILEAAISHNEAALEASIYEHLKRHLLPTKIKLPERRSANLQNAHRST